MATHPRALLGPLVLALTLVMLTSPASGRSGPRVGGRLAGSGPSVASAASADRVARPDIVALIIDDLPQIDDRLWRRLPTIRRLFLDGGVRFTDAIGNDPLCCPGRANLLT